MSLSLLLLELRNSSLLSPGNILSLYLEKNMITEFEIIHVQ